MQYLGRWRNCYVQRDNLTMKVRQLQEGGDTSLTSASETSMLEVSSRHSDSCTLTKVLKLIPAYLFRPVGVQKLLIDLAWNMGA